MFDVTLRRFGIHRKKSTSFDIFTTPAEVKSAQAKSLEFIRIILPKMEYFAKNFFQRSIDLYFQRSLDLHDPAHRAIFEVLVSIFLVLVRS